MNPRSLPTGQKRSSSATAQRPAEPRTADRPEPPAGSPARPELPLAFSAGEPHLLGYARVSTAAQRTDRQVEALAAAGCSRVWVDEGVSGTRTSRPALDALLTYARPGDVVVISELSRLGRTVRGLVALVDDLGERGVGVRSITQGVDTSGGSAVSTLLLAVFSALAQVEREVLVERTRDGLESARRRGQPLGRPRALDDAQATEVAAMLTVGRPVAEVARLFGVGRATVRRAAERAAIVGAVAP